MRFLGAWLLIAAATTNIYIAKDDLRPIAWVSSVLIVVVGILLATNDKDEKPTSTDASGGP